MQSIIYAALNNKFPVGSELKTILNFLNIFKRLRKINGLFGFALKNVKEKEKLSDIVIK